MAADVLCVCNKLISTDKAEMLKLGFYYLLQHTFVPLNYWTLFNPLTYYHWKKSNLSVSCVRMAFCSAALLGPGGSALGLMGFPFGIQRDGPTLSTPSSAGGTVATVAAAATGCDGGCCCCCSNASVTKPWLRIRALEDTGKKSTGKKIIHFI